MSSVFEDLFVRPEIRQRIRDNPIGPLLERYVEHLAARGYCHAIVRRYVRVAEHLGRWLGPKPLSQQAVRRFLRRHLPVCRCRHPAPRGRQQNRLALQGLLQMAGLAQTGRPRPSGFANRLLQRYERHLLRTRGLTAQSIRCCLPRARAMLRSLRAHRNSHLAAWTPQCIVGYVSGQARGRPPGTANVIASAIRGLLRFLLQEGLIRQDLAAAVPTVACWRLAPVPKTLQEQEVNRLIRVAQVPTPMGLRDRAILLCLSDLGLRASDVADLQRQGVDLDARVLHLRRRKERESVAVPMTARLADALRAYLDRGRPACPTPNVFVRHRAPVGQPLSSRGICSVVLRLASQAGLRQRIGGTHVLRHSLASRMLQAGGSLKQVADLLGHASINTTAVYAKVDLQALSQVALPWPTAREVQP